ncbi:MAG: class II aldolase/adducin family protein [Actinomycetota bacterium]
MGTGDLAAFREAGRALLSLGMIRGSEGNLSTWDGERLVITRTGSELAHLEETDVLEGSLDAPPEGASSDLEIHVRIYREEGPGAIAHAHPPGSVPAGWVEGREHGRYAHAATLEAAVEHIVREARGEA